MTKHQAIDRINRHLTQMDKRALEGLLLFLESSNGAADDETLAVLNDYPDILERVKRLESGESKTIPWEDVKAELGL